jgi:hypothetical protein
MPEDANVEENLPTPDIEGRLLYLRVEQPGFRPIDLYLFTTLSDPLQYPTQESQTAWTALFLRLAKCTLPKRKQARFEPRQVWGKPRVCPSIKGSRQQAREAERQKLAASIS